MQVQYERCCGIDVHKDTATACLIIPGVDGQPVKETRTLSTMTGDLNVLAQWLNDKGCTHVAMESTGVYWKPVYNLLEGTFEILVVNPTVIKKLKNKTDVADAEWIADLLRHGLLRGSFIPSAQQRILRDLTRYRTTLLDDRTREVNRLQKVLEDANLKLASVATDIMGVSGRAILTQLIEGQTDPTTLAELAKGKLRKKQALLEKALAGRLKPHHRFMLIQHLSHIDSLDELLAQLDAEIEEQMRPFQAGRLKPHHRFMLIQHLSHIDSLDELLAQLDAEIEEQMRPFQATVDRWDQLPGINQRGAQVIVAEVGADLKQFATAEHLASWAAMCPGNNQSGGKRKSGKTNKGNVWLRRALVEAAHGAARTKKSYFSALYHRLAGRRGKKRAKVAVGHSLLVTGYHSVASSHNQKYP